MPSTSTSMQRLFGAVHAYQTGRLTHASKKIRDMADSISPDDVTDFARTKHKGLPKHKGLRKHAMLAMAADMVSWKT